MKDKEIFDAISAILCTPDISDEVKVARCANFMMDLAMKRHPDDEELRRLRWRSMDIEQKWEAGDYSDDWIALEALRAATDAELAYLEKLEHRS